MDSGFHLFDKLCASPQQAIAGFVPPVKPIKVYHVLGAVRKGRKIFGAACFFRGGYGRRGSGGVGVYGLCWPGD
jgi:hypothetical protein